MRRLLIVSCTLLSGCSTTMLERMNNTDPQKLRVAYHALTVADAGFTMSRNPDCTREANPILGSNPSDAEVAGFAVAQMLIFEGIYHYLERNHPEQLQPFGWAFNIVRTLSLGITANTVLKGCD